MLSINEFIGLPYLQKVQKMIFILSEFNTKKTEKLKTELLNNDAYPEKKLVALYKAIYALVETKRKARREKQQQSLENIKQAKQAQKTPDIDALIKQL